MRSTALRSIVGGYSTLEAAGVLLLGLVLVISSVGVVSYLHMQSTFRDIIVRAAYDDSHTSSRSSSSLDSDLRAQLDHIADGTEHNIRSLLGGHAAPGKFVIDFSVFHIRYDTRRGHFKSFVNLPRFHTTRGSLIVPLEVSQSLERMQLVQKFLEQGAAGPAPLATYGISGLPQYHSQAMLLVVRGILSFEGSITSQVVENLHIASSPLLAHGVVNFLRGGIE